VEDIYTGGSFQQWQISKTVEYRCGCEVKLHIFSKQESAPLHCEKHHKGIKQIITTERNLLND
jgi:hypothetical protein